MQTKLYSDPTKRIGRQFIPVLLAVFLIPSLGHAQEQQHQDFISEPTVDGGGGVQVNSNAAVLQELQTMRNRIEQHEAQLKAQSTAKNDTTSTDTAERLETARQSLVAAGTVPVVPSAMQPSIATASISAPKPAATPPTPPEKSAPFAFANWTWLNGNPRTETPAFDSKFFTPEIRSD